MMYGAGKIGEFEGRLIAIADVLGDWREEIIVSLPGEIRIYTTTIPTARRRVCLLQDPLYRKGVALQTMGYFYPPQLSYHFR
jgi:rhamnogalacturonan endolyase